MTQAAGGNMRENVKYIGGVFLLMFLAVLMSVLANQRNVAVKENAFLKRERIEWQKAGMLAIRARGWNGRGINKPEELKPVHLHFALNPCFTTSSGEWRKWSGECQDRSMLGMPIRIEPADFWP